MATIINFFKNLFLINTDESYIGLSSFSSLSNRVQKRPQKVVKKSEMSLTELLRKN
ncbi:hypothetical protein IKA15_00655 [bacterium]|nr:hypothetical protein [bacterium]